MARPRKNNADYFSHDNNMRNHRKIKALRNTFRFMGYAVFNMFLETLTECDGFIISLNKEIEWELLAADFSCTSEELHKILEYCTQIELLTNTNGKYFSSNLVERLTPLIEKREYLRDKYTEKAVSTAETIVSTAEMPQSKVNKSKVNKYMLSHKKPKIKKTINDLIETGDIGLGDFSKTGTPSPLDVKIEKKHQGSDFGRMCICLGYAFDERYFKRFDEHYKNGTFSVSGIAKNISKYKEYKKDDWIKIIEFYFESKKSRELVVTLEACFSENTIMQYKQTNKKSNGIVYFKKAE